MKRSISTGIAITLASTIAFCSNASATSGTWNCGPSLRLQLSTNLGPNPALITHVVNGVTLFNSVAVSHISYYSAASTGTWSATPNGTKACVV